MLQKSKIAGRLGFVKIVSNLQMQVISNFHGILYSIHQKLLDAYFLEELRDDI